MIEYEVNANFEKDVRAVLDDKEFVEFNPIRELEITILTLVAIQTDADDEHVQCKGRPVTCKKIPAEYKALTNGHYLVRADYYFWTHANDIEKKAAIHRALMAIQVEKGKKTGKIALKSRKPDVMEYRATIHRFGAYCEDLVDFREAFKASAKQLVDSHKPKALENRN